MSNLEEAKGTRASSLDISANDLAELSNAATDLVRDYFESISERAVFPENRAGKTTQQLSAELPLEGAPLKDLIEENGEPGKAKR